MTFSRILIANRGEVAVRVIRTASEMGIETVAIYSQDDAASLHISLADVAVPLEGSGAAAYLDGAGIIELAREHSCQAIHPGWGFLSENAGFAELCGQAGITFIGPTPAVLATLGDKAHARLLAADCGVPILDGIDAAVSIDEARAFLRQRGPGGAMIIKAVAGGGGRGMRVVRDEAALESAYRRCQSEALNAFGNASVYVEELFPRARHVEVQVIGDGTGNVSHLWERDCSIQRSHQKVVEIAPSPGLHPAVRARLTSDAVRMASRLNYRGLGTFEFLVDADTAATDPGARYAFIEANARLQVEHTITEEVCGLDLVRAQVALAAGATLDQLGLRQESIAEPRGMAIQFRINSESIGPDGRIRPSTGALAAYRPPSGPGVRVDSHAYAGYAPSSSFDSLLGKVIVHSPGGWPEAIERGRRALRELLVSGPATNASFLRNLLDHPRFAARDFHTTFVDEELESLCAPRSDEASPLPVPALTGHTAGARVDANDPLAVLTFGKSSQRPASEAPAFGAEAEPGSVLAPMQGTVVSLEVAVGDTVVRGQEIAILNAMKMEHVLRASVAGVVRRLNAAPGDTVRAGQLIVLIEPSADDAAVHAGAAAIDLDRIRPDLAEVLERHDRTLDAARADSVARRHASGHQTARENIERLVDPGTFVEIGPVVVAADARFTLDELITKSPADGMIVGIASINGEHFGSPTKQCMVMSYDYMVFAGTQGGRNHQKTDRALAMAEEAALPIVLFAEGGGGRAGGGGGAMRADREPPPPWMGGSAGSNRTFAHFARMSGLVPLVGITTGRCFAGNASLLGCCDVIIATSDANIGMGGPAMVEGGGLGVFAPEEIGPMSVQVPNGVVDIAVRDEKEGVEVARKYLGYFQGPIRDWTARDQRELRHIVPENRLRVYDPQVLLETLCDEGSVLELRKHFGQGMYTAFGRIEGRPIGIVGNDPRFVGGAITSDGSDKAARFMQLCDAFDIPLLFLCDTPGMMVGPEVEKTALVRHCSRMFVIGANVSVPCMTIVVRKAYGLGALAMAAGSFKAPLFTISWPTGEYGGMGLEGSVKLGYRNELAAIADPDERKRVFDEMVADAYERGKALNEATVFGVDDVIDPADSRRWVSTMLESVRTEPRGKAKKRMAVDTW
ncbi:MAG: ATP-grasp domain-containing protein [Dehalococcoidia bacterium]|nr:ATP-grasp domain-containing protein [Dehalococcoidia bacterium]